MEKRKIWIISELFYPDEASTGYIMTEIAMFIAEGKDVHVICGPIGYEMGSVNSIMPEFNFTVHRIKTFNFNKNKIIGRLVRLTVLSLGMFFKGLFSIKKNDIVLIVTNPAFVIPFYGIIRKIKGNKLIILIHDVFPENLIPSKIISSKSNCVYRITKGIFDWSYAQGSMLVVLGLDMLEIMRSKTNSQIPITIIENWASDGIKPQSFLSNSLIVRYNLKEKIVFTFAGNLGRMQGLEFLFKIIMKIHNPRVHFLFIGGGALIDELKKDVVKYEITSVTFVGPLPRSEQNAFLNAAHVGLVTLSSDMYGLGVPSKSYNILAAGKPILFIGNKMSEIGRLVLDEGCGYAFDENDETEMLSFFNGLTDSSILDMEIMGIHARKIAETKYSQSIILNKFKEILK